VSILPGIYASQITGHLFTAGTYDSIATVTVGAGGSSSISFSSIPSTYKHLQIRAIVRTNRTSTGDGIDLRFNGDSSTNYSLHELYGSGASAGSYGAGSQSSASFYAIAGGNANANVFGVSIIDILDYASTTKNKTLRNLNGFENNDTNGQMTMNSAAWFSTSPINTITISPDNGPNFVTYSSFALYGIKG
jgi:hypothetical protein